MARTIDEAREIATLLQTLRVATTRYPGRELSPAAKEEIVQQNVLFVASLDTYDMEPVRRAFRKLMLGTGFPVLGELIAAVDAEKAEMEFDERVRLDAERRMLTAQPPKPPPTLEEAREIYRALPPHLKAALGSLYRRIQQRKSKDEDPECDESQQACGR